MEKKYKTDLGRLHDVCTGVLEGRQQGHTTLLIHELASLVQLNDPDINNIFCRTNRYEDLKYLTPMIIKIFDERGVNYVWTKKDKIAVMSTDGDHISVEAFIKIIPDFIWDKSSVVNKESIGYVDFRWKEQVWDGKNAI